MTDIVEGELPIDVLANQTYAHLLARWMVRPLVGTRVRPNHLTWLRLLIGLCSVAFLAIGTTSSSIVSGILWVVACILDRADGELARIADLRSESGRRLDYYSDLILDSTWFLGAGFGARDGWLGEFAPLLGILCCVCMVIVQWAGEMYERLCERGIRVWGGWRRFHLDDALFLFAAFTWLHVLTPILVGASAVLPFVAAATLVRYARLRGAASTGLSSHGSSWPGG